MNGQRPNLSVSEAVLQRRSVRAFLPTPIDRATIEAVLETARFAPSGGNVQPWHAVVVAGEPLAQLLVAVQAALDAGCLVGDYQSYPEPLPDPWMARRRKCAADLYDTIGIGWNDRLARAAQTARNFVGFDAPCILLCHTPRLMGAPQWADLGLWLQTVMLLLEEAGLGSCPQGAWSHVATPIREALRIDANHILYCGLAIGYRDPDAPVNGLRTSRAPLCDTIRFVGF